MNNYIEKVEVSRLIYDYTEDLSTEIFVKVKGIEVECFNPYRDDFEVGKEYRVKFKLLTFDVKGINDKEKCVRVEDRYGSVCHCILAGELLDIKENYRESDGKRFYYKDGIVDCGIYVKVELPEDSTLKIYDRIIAEGRLDIVLS